MPALIPAEPLGQWCEGWSFTGKVAAHVLLALGFICARLPVAGRRALAERCTSAFLRVVEREVPRKWSREVEPTRPLATLVDIADWRGGQQ